jgi:hypothetical protein
MDKATMLKAIDEIDNLLAKVTAPALSRQDQSVIVEVIKNLRQRVTKSFELEEKVKELEEKIKEETEEVKRDE